MGLFDRIKRAFTGEDKVVKEEIEQESSAVVFDSYDKGLEKTRTNFTDLLSNLFTGFREVDEDFYEDLEETLIGADVGFNMTLALTDAIRDEIESQNVHKPEDVKRVMLEKMVQ